MAFKDLFKIKEFKKEIDDLTAQIKNYNFEINKLNSELVDSNKKNKALENSLEICKKQINEYKSNYIESKEANIDNFYTNEYKTQFETFLKKKTLTDDEILQKYNKLYNDESIYFEGIVSCIDFIKTKRKPKVSIEKQILNYILTNAGRTKLNSIINDVLNK